MFIQCAIEDNLTFLLSTWAKFKLYGSAYFKSLLPQDTSKKLPKYSFTISAFSKLLPII